MSHAIRSRGAGAARLALSESAAIVPFGVFRDRSAAPAMAKPLALDFSCFDEENTMASPPASKAVVEAPRAELEAEAQQPEEQGEVPCAPRCPRRKRR